jgi:hypothetical protein
MAFSEEKSIPPILPINWADWEGDEHVQDMDATMEGIYFRIIKYLWKYDRIEFNYSKLAKQLCVGDQRQVRKFVERWGHLFRCVECGKTPERALGVKESGKGLGLLMPCSYCAHALSDPCSCPAPFVLHEKLKNYKNDVNSRVGLGTTQQNRTKPNTTATTGAASLSAPLQEQSSSPSKSKASASSTRGCNPLEFEGSIKSSVKNERGEFNEYEGAEVRRILDYLFVHHPSEYWTNPSKGNITTLPRLCQAIDQMAKQVPREWTPSAPKPPKSARPKGDPSCRKCFGRGLVTVRSGSDLSMVAAACDCIMGGKP